MINFDAVPLPKLEKTTSVFTSLARSILYQQLSIHAAAAIEKKMCSLFGNQFPTPTQLLGTDDVELKSAGVSRQKIAYLKDLATHCTHTEYTIDHFEHMTDEAIIDLLTEIKGIGRWTAEMFLIFGLNRPDVLPLDDIGIHKGFVKVFNLKKRPSIHTMKRLSKPYHGKRTQLSLYLWKSIDGKDVVL